MSGVLVDTEVLVVAFGPPEGDARTLKAKEELERLARAGNGFVGLQNLAEFSSVLRTRVSDPVPPGALREAIGRLEGVLGVLCPSSLTLSHTLLGVEKHQLPFWEAMLWALAHENGVEEILTGELPGRPSIEGVRYRNLFA